MTHGIDTDFLVALEITDHPFHLPADRLLAELLNQGHDFAVAPQTLAEFIHIVTDSKRMPNPLSMSDAISRAEQWWDAEEVIRVFPADGTASTFFTWLRRHHLGRKRLLDTMLAATMKEAGIRHLVTNNVGDYDGFGEFQIVSFCA